MSNEEPRDKNRERGKEEKRNMANKPNAKGQGTGKRNQEMKDLPPGEKNARKVKSRPEIPRRWRSFERLAADIEREMRTQVTTNSIKTKDLPRADEEREEV